MNHLEREDLSAPSEPWQSILNSLGDAVIAADTQGKVICLNPAAEQLTGWQQQEALGQDIGSIYNVIEQTSGRSVARILAEIARGGEVVAVKLDLVLVGREGAGTSIRDTAAPLRDAEHQTIGVVVVFHDVTDERQAYRESEEARERLRQAVIEAHHRAKNSLSLVAAFVEMQAEEENEALPTAAAQTLALRIRTLSQIHALLTEGARSEQTNGMQVRETLAALMPMLQATVTPRLVQLARGAQICLPARSTTALALIVNELVTNAIKHSTGIVDVQLTVVGSEAILEVRDQGSGFLPGFDVRRQAHTGLELVEQLARHDLQGRTEYDTLPEGGGRVRVVFPLPRA